MTKTTSKSLIDTAVDAAFPGLPDGMTMDEARRRITKALAAVDWLIREEAAAGVLRGVSERITEYGRQTGDPQTARAYERVALDF
jgi:hypothetical protein